MTPQEILALSEPVEAIYTDVTTQLIWNICKRLGQGKELKNWQAKKLGELDALTKDAVKIISNSTGKAQRTIKSTLAKALGIELKDVEAILKGAVQAGKIPDIGFTVEQSQGLKQLLQSLSDQAVDQTNLVNTVMLNSTRQRYIWAVNNTVQEEQKLIQRLYSARDYDELEQQTAKVQRALNKAAGTVEAGAEARVQALSRTVKELAQEGITGYIDRGGHHWSPEAYINMDIRTTVHNAAIQAQRTRAEEYGVETFQISSHAGARPLCAPYQGKFYSWDGSSGVLHDLYGKEYYYESIGNTSYGEPAGIFGINCGHNPQTFVDGYNIPRYEETKDAEANAAEYRESQKQRYYEREVRQAKLEAIAQDAAGNKDAFNQAAAKVRQANANYKEFCKETGRTPRPDRLQVLTSTDGTGYNRSVSAKAVWAARKYNQQDAETVKAVSGARITNIYSKRAIEHAERYYGLVRSMRTDVARIAENTGFETSLIQAIKDFVFYEKHDLGDGRIDRFDADFAMAQSWQRLILGKPETHDLTLLRHEAMERELMRNGLTQDEAHRRTSEKYNYDKEVNEFYASLKEHKNK